jgi:hypothetical protein
MSRYYRCPECHEIVERPPGSRVFCDGNGNIWTNPAQEPEFGYERMFEVVIVDPADLRAALEIAGNAPSDISFDPIYYRLESALNG